MDTDRPHDVPTLADLTAAEIFVLRYAPAMRPDAEPLKLALQELVAGGALRLVLAARRLSRGGRPVLIAGPAYAEPAAAALAPVLALHAEQGGAVPVPDLAKAARKAFGGPGGYAEHEVAPVLGARGLLTIERAGVRGRACYRRTPAGSVVDESSSGGWTRRGAAPRRPGCSRAARRSCCSITCIRAPGRSSGCTRAAAPATAPATRR